MMPADCEVRTPEQYRLSAKNRADPAGNSSKACCIVILFRTSLHHSFQEPSIEYYRIIVKEKTSISRFFCVLGGEVLDRQPLTAIPPTQKGLSLLFNHIGNVKQNRPPGRNPRRQVVFGGGEGAAIFIKDGKKMAVSPLSPQPSMIVTGLRPAYYQDTARDFHGLKGSFHHLHQSINGQYNIFKPSDDQFESF